MAVHNVFVMFVCLQLTFAEELVPLTTSDLFGGEESFHLPDLSGAISDLNDTSIWLNNLLRQHPNNTSKSEESGPREKNNKTLPMIAAEVDEHEISIKILQYEVEEQQKRMEVLENSSRDQSAEIVTLKSENGQLEKRITTLLNEGRTMNEKVTMLENANGILQEKFEYLENTSRILGEKIIQLESTIKIVNKTVKIIDKQGCRNVVVFKNVPEKENEIYESLLNTTLGILNNLMDLGIKQEEIAYVWRDGSEEVLRSLGEEDSNSVDRYPASNSPRPIFVRFVNHLMKLWALRGEEQLNKTAIKVLDVDNC